jgi:hypothetical protein
MDKLKTPPLLAWDVGAAEVGLIITPSSFWFVLFFFLLIVLMALLCLL